MDSITSVFGNAFRDSSTILMALLVFLAAGTLAFSLMAAVRVRGAVKKRTSRIMDDQERRGSSRSLQNSSAKTVSKLLEYTTKHYGESNGENMKVLRRRLIQAGKPIHDRVGHQVQGAVEERVETGHAAEPDQRVPAGHLAQRRDRERQADEPERPDTGFVGEIGERIGAEVTRQRRPDQVRERPERRQKDERLQPEPNGTIRQLQAASP